MAVDLEVAALHPNVPENVSLAILGAMAAVAESGPAPARSEDIEMIRSAWRFIFGETSELNWTALSRVEPKSLASSVADAGLREDALKFLTVMTCIDDVPGPAKVDSVRRYAAALNVDAAYLNLLSLASDGHMDDALAEMTRLNMDSITNGKWPGGDANAWLLPYAGQAADPVLASRFHALSKYPLSSFGRAFHHQFTSNGYEFPGEAKALNAGFSVPHDSAHVISGYDTTPRGEILVSVFTSTMHKRLPMGAHVLPVIFIWHLHIQINAVAGKAATPMDPQNFWCAWAAGAASKADSFAPEWDFWALAERPLAEVRKIFGVPTEGLEAWADAQGLGPATP
ncbi:hypothetical protein [Methylocapsa acidiphila]|uniref:hypothetical protein n=1 Tax=Methylocapsa acidiphila TaxID=133552 RepID=UPI0004017E1F|nr:hypothetical protein [Methylocapsa acidiphila]